MFSPVFTAGFGPDLESQHPCCFPFLGLPAIFPLTGMMLKDQNLLNCLCLDDM